MGIELKLTETQHAKMRMHLKNPKPEMDVEIGVRPEHFRMRTMNDTNVIVARSDISERMGSEVFIHTRLAEKETIMRVGLGDLPDDYDFEAGAQNELYFDFPVKRIQIFDTETGENYLKAFTLS
jgi:ABC-type sugar transport system ATPase subunit